MCLIEFLMFTMFILQCLYGFTNIMSSESAFITDPEFCPECGTILPLPGDEDTVTCRGCKYKVNVKSKLN